MVLDFDNGTENYTKSPLVFSGGTCGKQVCNSLSNIGRKTVDRVFIMQQLSCHNDSKQSNDTKDELALCLLYVYIYT